MPATNIVGLGALVVLARLTSEPSMREALAALAAPESLALSTGAFIAGLKPPVGPTGERELPARQS